MMHKAWSSIEEVPYCFSRSSVKFQGHIALKIVKIDSNWAFPDCNSSLNSPMAIKCCTKLEIAKKRCLIVFQGHPSNFKVTRDKTSPIFTQIGRFRTIGRSQLSNPSDLPCSPPCLQTSVPDSGGEALSSARQKTSWVPVRPQQYVWQSCTLVKGCGGLQTQTRCWWVVILHWLYLSKEKINDK